MFTPFSLKVALSGKSLIDLHKTTLKPKDKHECTSVEHQSVQSLRCPHPSTAITYKEMTSGVTVKLDFPLL